MTKTAPKKKKRLFSGHDKDVVTTTKVGTISRYYIYCYNFEAPFGGPTFVISLYRRLDRIILVKHTFFGVKPE